MSTETESARACLGHLCLVAKPENPEQAGWRDGYCPDCQDELARDEIRAERQDARNEVEIETPITDDAYQQRNGESHFEHVVRKQETMESLERQLAESNKARDDYFAAWTTCIRKRGELKEKLAEAREQIEQLEIRHAATMLHTQSIVDDANKAIDQRDRLAEALRNLAGECEYQAKSGQFNDDRIEMDQARSALATLDRKESE